MKPTSAMSNKRPKPAHESTPYPSSASQALLHNNPAINRMQILQNFGLTDPTELETLNAFLDNFGRFGCEPLKNGLTSMFMGMKNAMDVYSHMKAEIHSLHEGIVELKKELTEAKEQHLIAEAAAIHSAEVRKFKQHSS